MITLERGTVIAGRYELVRCLAVGGQGSVWRAHHHELARDVAVKFMLDSELAGPQARARFDREARAAGGLGSQYVVQILDYGVDRATPFIVMELLDGVSLGDRLKREGRLSRPVVARILVQVCKALRTAHEAGLVHRDLKPGNIFLALKDEEEVAKVLDFGIAKASGPGETDTKTDTNMILGSVHYMSPEQIRSPRDVDHRADLWSLGVILYRALVGRLPFQTRERGDLMVRICTDPIPPPSSIAPDLPAHVDRFFERALARDPDHRFQSARELAEAFCAIPPDPSTVQPAPAPALQRRGTIPITARAVLFQESAPPGEAAPGPVRSDVTTRKRPAPTPLPPSLGSAEPPLGGRALYPSSADDPTFAVAPEAQTVPTEAAMVSDRASDTAQVLQRMRGRGRRLWPVWAALAIVAVAGALAVVLQPGTGPQSAPSAAPAAPSMPSPALPPEPTGLPSSPPSAPFAASPSASTTVSAAPNGIASSRDNGGILRVDPFPTAAPRPTETPAASATHKAPTAPRSRPVMP